MWMTRNVAFLRRFEANTAAERTVQGSVGRGAQTAAFSALVQGAGGDEGHGLPGISVIAALAIAGVNLNERTMSSTC